MLNTTCSKVTCPGVPMSFTLKGLHGPVREQIVSTWRIIASQKRGVPRVCVDYRGMMRFTYLEGHGDLISRFFNGDDWVIIWVIGVLNLLATAHSPPDPPRMNRGTPLSTPIYYSPHYGDRLHGTPNFRNPQHCFRASLQAHISVNQA